jgi:hypothetical protein
MIASIECTHEFIYMLATFAIGAVVKSEVNVLGSVRRAVVPVNIAKTCKSSSIATCTFIQAVLPRDLNLPASEYVSGTSLMPLLLNIIEVSVV